MSDVLVTKHAALIEHDGQTVILKAGTTVRVGHPIIDGHEGLFEPLRVQYDLEETTETADDLEETTETADATPPARAPRGKATETR